MEERIKSLEERVAALERKAQGQQNPERYKTAFMIVCQQFLDERNLELVRGKSEGIQPQEH